MKGSVVCFGHRFKKKSFHSVVVSFVWRTFEIWKSAENEFWTGQQRATSGREIWSYIHSSSFDHLERAGYPIRLNLIESSTARRKRVVIHFMSIYT